MSDPPADKKTSVTLRLHLTHLTAQHGLQVKLNGQQLKLVTSTPALSDQPQDVWLEYVPALTFFQVPKNLVTASVAHVEGTVKIDNAQLTVLFRD